MLYFNVSPETQVSRLAAKYKKTNTNVDMSVLQRKQIVFTKSSTKVVKYYKQNGIIRTINAEMTTIEVTRTVTSAIEGL
jgi:adenylate kinase family enzyme